MKSALSRRSAFTLTEVLIGLGLAAVVMGVSLQAAARDTMTVSRSAERYQALLRASQVLEYRMEEDRQGGEDATGSLGEKFPYDLSTRPVVSDARVEQVEVVVAGGGRRESVSAYRLRIRRKNDPQQGPQNAAPADNPDLAP